MYLHKFDLFSFSFCLIYIDNIVDINQPMVSFIDGSEDKIDTNQPMVSFIDC